MSQQQWLAAGSIVDQMADALIYADGQRGGHGRCQPAMRGASFKPICRLTRQIASKTGPIGSRA